MKKREKGKERLINCWRYARVIWLSTEITLSTFTFYRGKIDWISLSCCSEGSLHEICHDELRKIIRKGKKRSSPLSLAYY